MFNFAKNRIMRDLLHDTKQEKENIIYEAKLHWILYVKPIFIIIMAIPLMYLYMVTFWFSLNDFKIVVPAFKLVNIIDFIVPTIILLWVLKSILRILFLKMTRIYLTNRGLTLETGILSKQIDDISLNKYEGMSIHQSFLGRILNYGVLVVSTGELNQGYMIAKPLVLREYILKQKAQN